MQIWWRRLTDVTVTVHSLFEDAIRKDGTTSKVVSPESGVHRYNKGEAQTFSVKSPYFENKTLGGKTLYKKAWNCTGYTGTGSVPAKGPGTIVTLPVEEDSTITWNWVGGQVGPQALSIFAFATIFAIALVATYWLPHAFILAISAGALGGLAHEIVQSGGKYILPGTDEKGNFMLGGLIGIVTGGVAGLLMYQGLMGTAPVNVDMKLVVEALVAGLAVKGIADAPNPK